MKTYRDFGCVFKVLAGSYHTRYNTLIQPGFNFLKAELNLSKFWSPSVTGRPGMVLPLSNNQCHSSNFNLLSTKKIAEVCFVLWTLCGHFLFGFSQTGPLRNWQMRGAMQQQEPRGRFLLRLL